ncbi:hypothetical protein GC175_22815 [bacterium]|nr:hypothetical protein [bacterium]
MSESAFQAWHESQATKQEDQEFRKLLKELERVPDAKQRVQEFSAQYQQIISDAQRIAFLAGARAARVEESFGEGWQEISEYFGPIELK